MNKIITTTQYNRPEYTKQMLYYLSKCKNIENYTIVASVEPGNNYILSLLNNIDFCDKIIVINDKKLTCNLNTLKALYLGFQYSDNVLHVEDDVILGYDALEMYEQMLNIDGYFSYSLYSKINSNDYTKDKYSLIMKRDGFVPWGFGLPKKSFLKTLEWNCYCPETSHYNSWDCRIDENCRALKYKHLFTFLSRGNNIGAENGVHVPSKEWHKENQYLDFWVENIQGP